MPKISKEAPLEKAAPAPPQPSTQPGGDPGHDGAGPPEPGQTPPPVGRQGLVGVLAFELLLPLLTLVLLLVSEAPPDPGSPDPRWIQVTQKPAADPASPMLVGAITKIDGKDLTKTGVPGPNPVLGTVEPNPFLPVPTYLAWVRYSDTIVVDGDRAALLSSGFGQDGSGGGPGTSAAQSNPEQAGPEQTPPPGFASRAPDGLNMPDLDPAELGPPPPQTGSDEGLARAALYRAVGDPCCRATQPEVVTAAVLHALVLAERSGLPHLQILPLAVADDALTYDEFFVAAADGFQRAAPSLRTLRRIDFVLPLEQYIDPDVFEAAVAPAPLARALRLVETPVRWPGGSRFAEKERTPADAPLEVSGAAGLRAPVTAWPAACFFGILAFAWVGLARTHGSPTLATYANFSSSFGALMKRVGGWKTPLFALFAWFVLFAIFLVLNGLVLGRLWIVAPDSALATPAGATLVATLMASTLAVGLVVAGRRGRRRMVAGQGAQAERDNLMRTALVRETPVTELADNRLSFGPVVEAFRRFLDNAQTEPPVVVGINGPWGSGKSSIMAMVSSELLKTDRFRTVWFNAWRYQNEEQAMAAFLQALARQLSADWGLWKGFRIASLRFRSLGFWSMLLLLAPVAAIVAAWRSGVDAAGVLDALVQAEAGTPMAVLGALLAVGASIRGVPWLSSFFGPFRLRFEKLFETKDYSARIGFLEEFTREFQLYRRVAGNRKLLVMVDDLDRCSPEHVVDVLKAINLIVTSDTGAGKTFFLLGFDREYVTRAVQVHFAKFSAGNPDFAEQYLKKMITLSVQVPRSEPDAIEDLVVSLDRMGLAPPGAEPEVREPGLADRLTLALRKVPGWAIRLAAATAVLWLVVAALPTEVPEPEPSPIVTAETARGPVSGAGSPASGVSSVVFLGDAIPIALPPTPWWAWTPSGFLVALALLWILRHRPVEAEMRYRREEQDSRELMETIRQCRELLPSNPRDAIRLVNRLRMGYLVQSLSPGERLGERDFIVLGLFFDRFPLVLEALLDRGSGGPDALWFTAADRLLRNPRYEAFEAFEAFGEDLGSKLAAAVAILDANGADISVLFRYSSVHRFAALHHELEGP